MYKFQYSSRSMYGTYKNVEMKSIWIALLCCLTFSTANAQDNTLADLMFYSDVMVNANSETHRMRANNAFKKLFDKTVRQENAIAFPFESIPYIKTLTAIDSSFKIVTFNYTEESGKTVDFGYVVTPETHYELNPTNDLADIEYEELDKNRWISGLYYHMVPFQNGDKTYYILFGYSQPNFYEKRKVLEIFSLNEGVPTFGAELFVEKIEGSRDVVKQRAIYYYSADVAMSIRDDKDFNAIVVDHLMEVKSRIPGHSGNAYVPDGTYTAFFLREGYWEYKDKLFEQEDVTPIVEKESEEQKRDIFGRNNKKQ